MCFAHGAMVCLLLEKAFQNTRAVQQTLLFPALCLLQTPPAENIDAGRPGLRMVFELWCVEGGMHHLVCKACRGSGIRLVSEGRNLDAVTEKTILKIESENLWRSLCCHSYSSGLQKYLKSSNKHDIKTKTGLPGF